MTFSTYTRNNCLDDDVHHHHHHEDDNDNHDDAVDEVFDLAPTCEVEQIKKCCTCNGKERGGGGDVVRRREINHARGGIIARAVQEVLLKRKKFCWRREFAIPVLVD